MTSALISTETDPSAADSRHAASWTFLTNHSHVLVCLAETPHSRVRDVAERVGITERAVQRILTDLEDAGFLTRSKDGRRNAYHIHLNLPLRHSIEGHRTARELLDLIRNPSNPA